MFVDLLSIGEFAKRSRLSPKALRLYDELGLLLPAQVDPDNGYRFYDVSQLERARQISMLRRIDVPLAQIRVIIDEEPLAAAEQIEEFWAAVDALHDDRRALARYLINELRGERSTVHEVTTREVPERTLLYLKRHVDGQPEVWALGKEFVGYFKDRPLEVHGDRENAMFLIYYGEVNADSDGPVEVCKPIPNDDARDLAKRYPELSVRTEAAHEEAVVHVGKGEKTEAQWQLISESLFSWVAGHDRQQDALGVRVTMFVEPPVTKDSVPDIDFSVPLVGVAAH
jgi:DNA-binding transcriptional MerR regulator